MIHKFTYLSLLVKEKERNFLKKNKIYNPWNIVQSYIIINNLLLPGSDRGAGHGRDSAQQRAVQKQHLPD